MNETAPALTEAETPLEFLLGIMRDAEHPLERRMQAAIAAAPYIHSKMKRIAPVAIDAVAPREIAFVPHQSCEVGVIETIEARTHTGFLSSPLCAMAVQRR